MSVKSNTIDLGELQDQLESLQKKQRAATLVLQRAKAALRRAEDSVIQLNDMVHCKRAALNDAVRELTK